jgi:hypothetical protein
VLDLDQAEVTRDRQHELARLPRLLGLPGGRKPSERAHVMQTVCHLDRQRFGLLCGERNRVRAELFRDRPYLSGCHAGCHDETRHVVAEVGA